MISRCLHVLMIFEVFHYRLAINVVIHHLDSYTGDDEVQAATFHLLISSEKIKQKFLVHFCSFVIFGLNYTCRLNYFVTADGRRVSSSPVL